MHEYLPYKDYIQNLIIQFDLKKGIPIFEIL